MKRFVWALVAGAVIGIAGCDDDNGGEEKQVIKSQFARASYQGPPLGNGNTYRPPPPVFFSPRCGNQDVGRAVREFSRANTEPVRGACNRYLYNQGRYKNYNELRGYVAQKMKTCGDPYLSRAWAEVLNTYTNRYCDIKLYHGGSWNSYEELRGYVLDYYCTIAPPRGDINRKDIICTNGETQNRQ